jgi:hypothetical protein
MRVILAIGLLLICGSARGETDVFMRAVGFALTGSDDAEPKAIDRAKCVFAMKNRVYRLNDVHTDRIAIQGWQRKTNWGIERWVEVGLHGDDVVVEETTEPQKDDGSQLMREMRQTNPDMFRSHHYTYKNASFT